MNRLPDGTTVIIPCIYNSGRRAYVRTTAGHPEVIHIQILDDPERPYQRGVDGYLHLDTAEISKKADYEGTGFIRDLWRAEAQEIIEAVREICKYFIAGKLTVLSDEKMITRRIISGENYEIVVPLSEAHLGGSWQHYYQDRSSWRDDAQAIKGDTIYYA